MRLCTRKLFCVFAGLFGGSAFGCYALGSHIDGFYQMLAPVFLGNSLSLFALAMLPLKNCLAPKIIGYGMIFGVLLFSADLLLRQFQGHHLFPYAAPIGGSFIILSWFGIALIAFSIKKDIFFTPND